MYTVHRVLYHIGKIIAVYNRKHLCNSYNKFQLESFSISFTQIQSIHTTVMAFQDYGVGNLPLTENELPSDQLDIFTAPIKNNAIISSKFTEIRLLTVLERYE